MREILEAVRLLSEAERGRLVEALQSGGNGSPTEERRRDALAGWCALAGSFESDHSDVSTDKYRHLGDPHGDDR